MNGTPLLGGKKLIACTVVSLPKTSMKVLGKASFVDGDGKTAIASFVFMDGWRIISGKDGPVFANGRHGFISIGAVLVGFVGFDRKVGVVLTAWGSKAQYDEAVAEISQPSFPDVVPLSALERRLQRTMRTRSRPPVPQSQLAATG